MGGEPFEAHSAGTHPKGVNPYTVRVLDELEIDISTERSKGVSEYEGQSFDYVITVCDAAATECPVFPGAPERIHWSLVDPAAVDGTDKEKLEAFQGTVRELSTRLAAFIRTTERATS
jgi:arsenate reductase